MTKIALLIRIDKLAHYPLDLQRILVRFGIEAEPAAYPDTMRIRNYSSHIIEIAEQKIGYLSSLLPFS